VKKTKDFLVLEEFHELIDRAVQQRWERDGRYSAKDILGDIRSDGKIWEAIAKQFAERVATTAIRQHMKTREPDTDPAQQKFPFANEVPIPSITYKGTKVSTLRATGEEYRCHEKWYENRLKGTVKRSKYDKKTLARIKGLGRIVGKYCETDTNATVRTVIEERHKRLEELRKQRSQRLSRALREPGR
jgi:hypothetical protein